MDGGQCGVHTYHNYTQERINKLLDELKKLGFTVTGSNPWDVDTHNHGVKLRGQWNASTGDLSVIVTDKSWIVSCSMVWGKIDPILEHVATASLE